MSVSVELWGSLRDRDALDDAFGTRGASDEVVIARAYERFGTDFLARISGRFAIAIRDGDKVVLARDPSGAVPLYVAGDSFVTKLERELELDEEPIAHWLRHGLWPSPARTAFRNFTSVPAGGMITLRSGRAKTRPFWTFSPLAIPRALELHEAARELEQKLRRAMSSADTLRGGEPLAVAALARCAPRSAKIAPPTNDAGDDALVAIARLAAHPLPHSSLIDLASIPAHAHVAGALGAREVLGGTDTALAAFVHALALSFEATPSPASLRALIEVGVPMDRGLAHPILAREAGASGSRVLRRWARQLPPAAARAILSVTREDEAPGGPEIPAMTGDPFTDRRFAEARDRTLEAHHAAAIRVAGERGSTFVAPFLDAEVVELLFSIPVATLIGEGQRMRIIGGEPIAPRVSPEESAADRARGLELFRRAFAASRR